MKYLINNVPFKTDKELQEYAKIILYSNNVNSILEGEELIFMSEYFEKLHHEWTAKKGTGILNIRRIMDKVYGKYRAFQIERIDNSYTDISYIIANIKAPRLEQDFKQALRWVIEPQIFDHKKTVFAQSSIIICPVSKESLRFDYCHADHFNPTFDEIVNNFTKLHQIDNLTKVVAPSRDNQMKAELKDEKIAKLFYDYHKTHAVIRLISPNANLTRKRTSK